MPSAGARWRDKLTYAGPCIAKCLGVAAYTDGECPERSKPGCDGCRKNISPVCSRGIEFSNSCYARCDWGPGPKLC